MESYMKIRTASKKDIPSLAGLMKQLGYPTTIEEMEGRFTNIESDNHYHTIVAEIDEKVVGMAGLCKGLFYEFNGLYVRIVAFVVDSNYRRRGIGEKLLVETERWSKEQGAIAIGLNSGKRSERAAAHNFYAKMSFETKSIGFSKSLV
ncbi:N-acetyltransferase family protein [Pradoshia sp.]